MSDETLDLLEKSLNYHFCWRDNLVRALTTKPYSLENGGNHRDALATLGDAVQRSVIVEIAIESGLSEKAEVTRFAERYVSEENQVDQFLCLLYMNSIKLPDIMRMGRGEISSAVYREPRFISTTFEAILGAVYLDTDIESVKMIAANAAHPLALDNQNFDDSDLFENYIPFFIKKKREDQRVGKKK